jgi:proteasome accessory factor A
MSEYAIALKVGTLQLVTELIDLGWSPTGLQLRHPVGAIKELSRDGSYEWATELTNSRRLKATDIQRIYQEQACREFSGRDADTDWTLSEWNATLNALDTDPMLLASKLDWVAKKSLIDDYVASEGGKWDEYHLQAIDLAYCDVDPDEGLYNALVDAGEMVRIVSNEAIIRAQTIPPSDTRAAIRGKLVELYSENIGNAGWSQVVLRTPDESWVADLDPYLTPDSVRQGLAKLTEPSTLQELIASFRN